MKKQVENIITYVGLGTIITIGIGSYIINLSLSKFQLVDFSLLQPHAIAVGLTFLVWLLAHGFFLVLFVNLEDFKSNSRKKLLLLTLVKFILLPSLLFPIMGGLEYYNDATWTWKIFLWQIDLGRVTFFLPLVFSLPFFLLYFDWLAEKKVIIYRIIYIMFIISVIASLINFFIYYYTPLYSDLLGFEILVFGIFIFSALSIIENQRGIGSSKKANWFSPGPPIKTFNFTLVFSIFLILLGLIGIIGNYTRNIFPHIPQSLGGGKLEKIRYKTEKEVFEGEKVYETKENVFLLNGDSIRKVDWVEIKKILPSNHRRRKDTVRIPFITKIK